MMRATLLMTALLMVVDLAGPLASASAQSAGNTTVARRLFREGIAATRDRNWQEAHDAFARSFELSARPTTLVNLAGTQRQLGQWVAAAESYRRFMSMATGRGRRVRTQLRVARTALDELEAAIPNLRVTAEDASYRDVDVSVDEEAMPAAAFGELYPLDPGDHIVRIEREGYRALELSITLEEGGEHALALEEQAWTPLIVEPEHVARNEVEAELENEDSGPEPTTRPVRRSPVLWTVVVLVVAGAVLGGVFGSRAGSPARYNGNVDPGRLQVP